MISYEFQLIGYFIDLFNETIKMKSRKVIKKHNLVKIKLNLRKMYKTFHGALQINVCWMFDELYLIIKRSIEHLTWRRKRIQKIKKEFGRRKKTNWGKIKLISFGPSIQSSVHGPVGNYCMHVAGLFLLGWDSEVFSEPSVKALSMATLHISNSASTTTHKHKERQSILC